jgi:hypothetical protein
MCSSRNRRRVPSDTRRGGSGQENQDAKLIALRAKVRQSQMILALVKESLDGNYDDFVASFNCFKAVNERYLDEIESEIACFDESDASPEV